MTAVETLAVALEAAVGVLLGLYALVLATGRRDRTPAARLLAGLCAAVAAMMGANLGQQLTGWRLFVDLALVGDLIAPPLVLGLVRQARSPPPRLGAAAALHLIPAAAGLAAWELGRLPSMDAYVIAIWALYLTAAAWLYLGHRAAYGSAVTRRLLSAVLGVSGVVLTLRLFLARSGAVEASFLRSPVYLAVLAVCLAAACLVLYAALRLASRGGAGGLVPAYAARPADAVELRDLEARLQAALAARIYADPNLDLDRLAQALDAPSRRVSRLINETQGMGVAAFLTERRVALAAERLLAHPDQPIKVVMYDAGFTSKSRFNEAFQRSLGVSPSEYRRRQRPAPREG